MVRVQRTLNPLHFEDLEPHRFEDLIRQLAYQFKRWKFLDATGRLGRDGGLDIRGVELVYSYTDAVESRLAESEGEESLADVIPASAVIERDWNIQCKRYKEIGPKLIRDIVDDSIRDKDKPPYGFVLAAACDVSADAMAEFRSAVFDVGVEEAHLWTKAHLEDRLFLPENDHLLFAYFGMSLGIRRNSRLQEIRVGINKKRRIMKALDVGISGRSSYGDILVRDVEDLTYWEPDDAKAFFSAQHPAWHPAAIDSFTGFYLAVVRYNHVAWLKKNGSWDLVPGSRQLRGASYHNSREFWGPLRGDFEESRRAYEDLIPEGERQLVQEIWVIDMDCILEVDPIGDAWNPCPQVFCEFDPAHGPYDRGPIYVYSKAYEGQKMLNSDQRATLFE